jgi:protein tyrosine/serine phosphatase
VHITEAGMLFDLFIEQGGAEKHCTHGKHKATIQEI